MRRQSETLKMLEAIDVRDDKTSIDITYLRGTKELTTDLKLVKDSNDIYKRYFGTTDIQAITLTAKEAFVGGDKRKTSDKNK